MTYSIGFRAPARGELARELLQRAGRRCRGRGRRPPVPRPGQAATDDAGRDPAALQQFAARRACAPRCKDPQALERALGEYLTEPKASVWFEAAAHARAALRAAALDRRTRMMYDARHVFINGESYRASGRDAQAHAAAGRPPQPGAGRARAGQRSGALSLLRSWCEAGLGPFGQESDDGDTHQ